MTSELFQDKKKMNEWNETTEETAAANDGTNMKEKEELKKRRLRV